MSGKTIRFTITAPKDWVRKRKMNRWLKIAIASVALYEAFLFGMVAHAHIFDCHYFSPQEEYELSCLDKDIPFEVWLADKEQKQASLWDRMLDQYVQIWDPTYVSDYDVPDGRDRD